MKWLATFLILTLVILGAKAEEITTGNLITNGNFETGNANNWTTSGDVQVLNDCCELNNVPSSYDLEFGDSGSVTQDFNLSSNSITQNMLDNGITLNSTIEAQNGECSVTGCWGGQGNADTFTNVLTIKDNEGNVLASNTNVRTDVTGINGANFTDTLIYTGTGSNVGNINISGSDANAPAYLGGPNVDNISVTMTYDDTVIANEVIEEINEVFEDLESVFEYIEFEQIQEIFEEMVVFFTEPPPMEEELSFEPVLMAIEEMPMEEEVVMEIEEEMVMELEETIEEEVMEMGAAEEEPIEEEIVKEKPKQIAEKSNEEEIKEEKPTSETTNKSTVSTEKVTKQKKIQSKTKTTNVKSQSKFVALEKTMEKVDKDIKDISKNLQIKNIIKLDAMASDQASLDVYNVPFYKSENIYLDQLEIQDLRQVYAEITLNSYIGNDPVKIREDKLQQITIERNQLLLELEVLKNG